MKMVMENSVNNLNLGEFNNYIVKNYKRLLNYTYSVIKGYGGNIHDAYDILQEFVCISQEKGYDPGIATMDGYAFSYLKHLCLKFRKEHLSICKPAYACEINREEEVNYVQYMYNTAYDMDAMLEFEAVEEIEELKSYIDALYNDIEVCEGSCGIKAEALINVIKKVITDKEYARKISSGKVHISQYISSVTTKESREIIANIVRLAFKYPQEFLKYA